MTRRQKDLMAVVAQIVKTIRDADADTLKGVSRELQKFHDAWLVSGEGADLPGLKYCCLNDLNVTERVQEAIDITLEQFEEEG